MYASNCSAYICFWVLGTWIFGRFQLYTKMDENLCFILSMVDLKNKYTWCVTAFLVFGNDD